MADETSKTESPVENQRKRRRQEWWSKKRRHVMNNDNKGQPNQVRKKIKKAEPSCEKYNAEKEHVPDKLRHILFVGNLSFECTEDNLRNHFSFTGGLKDVRILTKKDTGESKGCAFLEFESRTLQMKALKLHHSTLHGRRMNVELTCGGGGKGEKRMTKLKSKIGKMKETRKKAKLKRQETKRDTSCATLHN